MEDKGYLVELKGDGTARGTEVWINGKPAKRVQSIKLVIGVSEQPTLEVKFLVPFDGEDLIKFKMLAMSDDMVNLLMLSNEDDLTDQKERWEV